MQKYRFMTTVIPKVFLREDYNNKTYFDYRSFKRQWMNDVSSVAVRRRYRINKKAIWQYLR